MALSRSQKLTLLKMKLKGGMYSREEWAQVPLPTQEQLVVKEFVWVDTHSGNVFLTTLGRVAIR